MLPGKSVLSPLTVKQTDIVEMRGKEIEIERGREQERRSGREKER